MMVALAKTGSGRTERGKLGRKRNTAGVFVPPPAGGHTLERGCRGFAGAQSATARFGTCSLCCWVRPAKDASFGSYICPEPVLVNGLFVNQFACIKWRKKPFLAPLPRAGVVRQWSAVHAVVKVGFARRRRRTQRSLTRIFQARLKSHLSHIYPYYWSIELQTTVRYSRSTTQVLRKLYYTISS
jgi:hypothetical protein